MAETRYAARFRKVVAALRARGFAVIEESGCYSRTVGSKDLLDVRSHLVHHTAGGNDASDRRVVRDGRTGLRGPLAQWLTERDGRLRLLASGYANHAGPTSRRDEGNSYSTGNEIVSAGLRASDFTAEQVAASEALAQEMAREFGYGLDSWTVGHKEAGVPRGRKVDPAFSMPAFRARLATGPSSPTGPSPTAPTPDPEDWFDMATKEELREELNGALSAHLRDIEGALERAQRVDDDQTGKLDRLVAQTRFTDDRIAVGFREQAVARLTEDRVRRVVTEVVGAVPTATADELVRRLVALLSQPAPSELPAAPAAKAADAPAAVTR